MKEIMCGLAAMAAIGAFAVESANTVGYNSDTIMATKFNMVSVPFESTNGDGFKINECLSGVNLTGTASATTSDLIQIWDAATGAYENWYYYFANDEYTGWWDEAIPSSAAQSSRTCEPLNADGHWDGRRRRSGHAAEDRQGNRK